MKGAAGVTDHRVLVTRQGRTPPDPRRARSTLARRRLRHVGNRPSPRSESAQSARPGATTCADRAPVAGVRRPGRIRGTDEQRVRARSRVPVKGRVLGDRWSGSSVAATSAPFGSGRFVTVPPCPARRPGRTEHRQQHVVGPDDLGPAEVVAGQEIHRPGERLLGSDACTLSRHWPAGAGRRPTGRCRRRCGRARRPGRHRRGVGPGRRDGSGEYRVDGPDQRGTGRVRGSVGEHVGHRTAAVHGAYPDPGRAQP